VNNEIEAWCQECYVNYFPMVFRRCREILHNDDDAADTAHDIFEKVFSLKDEGRFDIRSEGFGGLLSKMAVNNSINQLRKKRREASRFFAMAINVSLNRVRDQVKKQDMGISDILDLSRNKPKDNPNHFDPQGDRVGYTPSVDEQIEYGLRQETMEVILKEEDEKTRDIYFMHCRYNMTFKEIGENVGLSTAAVQKRFKKFENKARLKLGRDQNNGNK
jgi:RNA polymerase sigma factor (sigma-70 family)